MKVVNQVEDDPAGADQDETNPLLPLVVGRSTTGAATSALAAAGTAVGQLVGLMENGSIPLLVLPGQGASGAIAGRSVVDLHGAHVGRDVVLVFDGGDAAKPIVIGVLRDGGSTLKKRPGHVEVDSDGERMIVSAKAQLVLRCGKASVTLTRSGKVLIQGTYVSSRSTGVNRIKGGSVHLN